MSFIYPECPACGAKASDGEGVGVYELPDFEWYCPDCKTVHTGRFDIGMHDVDWESSRSPTITDRLRRLF